MSGVNMPSKNKLGQLRMFISMASHTQNLNVGWIRPQTWLCAVRFNMVALQIFCAITFFTLALFCNDLGDYFSAAIFALASATIPFWMGGAFWHSRLCTTCCGAVFACAAIAFSNLKRFTTCFTYTIKQCFCFFWAQFVRTRMRTSVCFTTDMCVGPHKFDTANRACKNTMPAPFNFSLEITHG